MKLFIFSIFSVLLAGGPAWSGQEGKGGDAACADFAGTVGEIARGLRTMGQATVDKYDNLINVADFSRVAAKIKCIPVVSLPRELKAMTHIEPNGQVITELLWKFWKEISKDEKLRLSAHEASVALGYEQEGVYGVSSVIITAFKTTSPWRLENYCKSYRFNSDGSTVCIQPRCIDREDCDIQWTYTSYIGFCRRLGFSELIQAEEGTGQAIYAEIIGELGETSFWNHWKKHSHRIVSSIMCRGQL